MTQEPSWRFRRMGRDESSIDPVQPARPPKGAGGEEFFIAEELGDLNGALVRYCHTYDFELGNAA